MSFMNDYTQQCMLWLSDPFHVDCVPCACVQAEIMSYFNDYAPKYVLWLDDSSGNVVFSDANNAKRALCKSFPALRWALHGFQTS